jgi:protein-L-isoaspartate(D-aspartate) O-methyltransferase
LRLFLFDEDISEKPLNQPCSFTKLPVIFYSMIHSLFLKLPFYHLRPALVTMIILFVSPCLYGQNASPETPVELRALFLPDNLREFAAVESFIPLYPNGALPTPEFIAQSARLLRLDAGKTVLVIGTAAGYAAASLARLAGRVYVVEFSAERLDSYRQIWKALGLDNIETLNYPSLQEGNGDSGYDAVLIHGVTKTVPPRITGSLRQGGVLLAPLLDEKGNQLMVLMELNVDGWTLSSAGLSFFPARPLQFVD